MAWRMKPFGSDKGKAFFFEKKKQKTFILWAHDPLHDTLKSKSFLVLFFKKELLP